MIGAIVTNAPEQIIRDLLEAGADPDLKVGKERFGRELSARIAAEEDRKEAVLKIFAEFKKSSEAGKPGMTPKP